MKKPAIAIAAAFCILGGAASADAQESCGDLYNRVLGAYQYPGPASPEYNQIASYYGARCLGAAAGPAPYPAPYPGPYYAPQPAPVDPGAAIVGAAIVGGLLGAAVDGGGHHHHHRR